MPWAVAAAAVGAVGSIGGGILGANASESAAKMQQSAEAQAASTAQQYYTGAAGQLQPWQTAGTNALAAYQQALGLRQGGSGNFNPAAFQNSPGYQWDMSQGTQAITNSAAATGGFGGNTLKALQSYGTGLADQTWQNYLGNLTSLSNSGQNAGAQIGNFGITTGQTIGNALVGAGNAGAAGVIGAANSMSNGLSNAATNGLAAYNMVNGMTGGGSLAAGNYGSLSPYIYNGATNPGTSLAPGQYNF